MVLILLLHFSFSTAFSRYHISIITFPYYTRTHTPWCIHTWAQMSSHQHIVGKFMSTLRLVPVGWHTGQKVTSQKWFRCSYFPLLLLIKECLNDWASIACLGFPPVAWMLDEFMKILRSTVLVHPLTYAELHTPLTIPQTRAHTHINTTWCHKPPESAPP